MREHAKSMGIYVEGEEARKQAAPTKAAE